MIPSSVVGTLLFPTGPSLETIGLSEAFVELCVLLSCALVSVALLSVPAAVLAAVLSAAVVLSTALALYFLGVCPL